MVQWLGIRLPMWIGVYFGNPTQGDGGPARERGKWPNTGLCHSLDRGEPADLRIKAAQALDEFADKDV